MRVTLHRLFAAALLATTPFVATVGVRAAAPVPAAPKSKTENAMAAARKALDEVGDMNYQSRSLTDIINDVKQKTKVPVVLDNQVFQFGLDPNQPVVTVNLKQVKLRDGLKAALAPYNLKFGLTAEGVYISTEEGVITRQLRQRVSVDCDGTTFATAMKQLALDTGANVVVDPRLGKLADKPITLKLEDVPLETAIRLLSEVADLRAVRSSNVLFVTSHDKVKERGLTDDGPTNPSPLSPFFPMVGGGFNPPPGVIGGGIFVPGGVAPPAVEAAPLPDPATPPVAVPDKLAEKPAQAPPPPPVEKKP
jgi:hypothetical protein